MEGYFLKFHWSDLLTWKEFWAWAEVWALLIPLSVLLVKRKQIPPLLKPVVYYVLIAFFLNFAADFMWRFNSPRRLNIPWMSNNTVVYHVHSIARLLCFIWFFNLLREPFLVKVKKFIPWVLLFLLLINYTLIKTPRNFLLDYSSELLAAEAAILLFYCLQHYVYLAQAEQISYPHERAVNWIVAGLAIYVGVNFFIFLFYSTLIKVSLDFSVSIWDVHNVSYILLCCFIAIGLYESGKSRS